MSYKTAIKVDNEVHSYLFHAKERPGESFNSAVRRELGISSPEVDEGDDTDNEDSDDSEDRDPVPA